MYDLFSGISPFEPRKHMSDFDVLMATTQGAEPPPLSQVASATPEFSDFIQKAMQREPYKRHRTPALFIEELKKLRGRATRQN